jgi:hypothetical protein
MLILLTLISTNISNFSLYEYSIIITYYFIIIFLMM